MMIRGGGLASFLVLSVAALIAASYFVFGVSLPIKKAKKSDSEELYGSAQFDLKRLSFDDIDGWRAGSQAEALPVFLRSCERLAGLDADAPANSLEALGQIFPGDSVAGLAGDWQSVCAEAERVRNFSYIDTHAFTSGVRVFFETYFVPFQVLDIRQPTEALGGLSPSKTSTDGIYTGYFEPSYPAFKFRTEEFSAPVYKRPPDLVMVDLGAFREELAGQRIAGSVKSGRLIAYPDHQEINDGALDGKTGIIAWMKPTDLLFMQIQGSGRLEFRTGETVRVGYDGQNGHPYTAIGKPLIDMGEIPREEMSMQAIRTWLEGASKEDAERVRELNASYVFFRELTDIDPALGPIGAGGIQLTTGRSLAVDRRYHALGAPIWVAIDSSKSSLSEDMRRLFIAQDTGGAIRGPVRGDIYTGSGEGAGAVAGRFNEAGEMIVLVPIAAAARFQDR